MALIDLLKTPSVFKVGIPYGSGEISPNYNMQYGAAEGSKKIKNKVTSTNGLERDVPDFHLVDRVRWSYNDSNADPTYLDGGKKSHFQNGGLTDYLFRGGFETNKDRRRIDVKRISKFIYSSRYGKHFILRQGALQLLNPQVNTRTFNAGVSLIAQVAAADTIKFKRSGAVPLPVGTEKGVNETIGELLGAGNFVTNLLGGDYLDIKKEEARSHATNQYGLGDPSKKLPKEGLAGIADKVIGDLNPFKKKESYNVRIDPNKNPRLDRLNYQGIFLKGPTKYNLEAPKIKDFVNFRFEVIDSGNPLFSKVIAFRAFLENFSDSFNAAHNNIKFSGRGETFYTYNQFDRKIQVAFKIAPQTRDEINPLYQKLNFLAAQTAPNYSPKGRIRTPYMRLTIGDYLARVPGMLTTVNISWTKEFPWEIALDKNTNTQKVGVEKDVEGDPVDIIDRTSKGKDKDMKVLPQMLNVSINFTPIHDFVPNNEPDTPFIGLGVDESGANNWLPTNEKPEDAIIAFQSQEQGCLDADAVNYNPNATIDDGSCQYEDVAEDTYTLSGDYGADMGL